MILMENVQAYASEHLLFLKILNMDIIAVYIILGLMAVRLLLKRHPKNMLICSGVCEISTGLSGNICIGFQCV